jgi:hypothetical protein
MPGALVDGRKVSHFAMARMLVLGLVRFALKLSQRQKWSCVLASTQLTHPAATEAMRSYPKVLKK